MPDASAVPPQNPAGPFEEPTAFDPRQVKVARDQLAAAPGLLRDALAGLNDLQLDTKYRNWTIRQIAFHLADSHLHSLIRCKWALTEDRPTIRAYYEDRWVELADARHGPVDLALQTLDALHARFVTMIDGLTPEQIQRTYFHPESQQHVPLWNTFSQYAWHGRHHTAQIVWVREQQGW